MLFPNVLYYFEIRGGMGIESVSMTLSRASWHVLDALDASCAFMTNAHATPYCGNTATRFAQFWKKSPHMKKSIPFLDVLIQPIPILPFCRVGARLAEIAFAVAIFGLGDVSAQSHLPISCDCSARAFAGKNGVSKALYLAPVISSGLSTNL